MEQVGLGNNVNFVSSVVFLYVIKKCEAEECSEKSNAQSFSAIVRDSDLWYPGNFTSHAEWISTLTSTIIDSGVIQDEVFQCLSRMCKVHVSFYLTLENKNEHLNVNLCLLYSIKRIYM